MSLPKHIERQQSDISLILAPNITMEFVHVPAGDFLMGNNNVNDDNDPYPTDLPLHRVYLSEYFIGKYPVTVAQFNTFVLATDYLHQTDLDLKVKAMHPVARVNWLDAVAFCEWASQTTNRIIRLPTEAEWEKAARGLCPDPNKDELRLYPWGNITPHNNLCNFDSFVGDTTAVGKYSPQGDSPYGCVDMAGNVREWCNDWFKDEYHYDNYELPLKNPSGPRKGQYRILRGGSCACNKADYLRVSFRDSAPPDQLNSDVGFRCVTIR